MAAKLNSYKRHVELYRKEGTLAIFLWYKLSFNHLLIEPLKKTQFTEF